MQISPHAMVKIREEHATVAASAAAKLEGNLRMGARYEQKQAEQATLFYVTGDMTKMVVDNMGEEIEGEILLPGPNGWIIFENGTGVEQPCAPVGKDIMNFTDYPTAEIYGLFYYHDEDKNLYINPIFKAETLRNIDSRLLPKKFYKTWAPFKNHTILLMLMHDPRMMLPHTLLKTLASMMPTSDLQQLKVRAQVKGKVKNVEYWQVDVPVMQEQKEVAEVLV